MTRKVAQAIISLVLVLSVGSGSACAAFSPSVWKSPCQKDEVMDHGAGPLSSKPCTMSPCRSEKGRMFTLPDSIAARIERENHLKSKSVGLGEIWGASSVVLSPSPSGRYAPDLLLAGQLPHFIMDCSLLC